MYDSPTIAGSDNYGSLEDCSEEVQNLCEQICKSGGMTISGLRSVSDYFSGKASKLSEIANNDVTIDEFEKAKKEPETDYAETESD